MCSDKYVCFVLTNNWQMACDGDDVDVGLPPELNLAGTFWNRLAVEEIHADARFACCCGCGVAFTDVSSSDDILVRCECVPCGFCGGLGNRRPLSAFGALTMVATALVGCSNASSEGGAALLLP